MAVGLLLFDKFALRSDAPTTTVQEAAATGNSVAVLPFVDMSPAKDQDYFTDGLTENLLHALAQVRELKVAGRTSSFAFKNQNLDLREIGRQLNVSNILEGSVRKSGKRIRVSAELIDARDEQNCWSERYDRRMEDVFAIQEEIAAAVVKNFQLQLGQPIAHAAMQAKAERQMLPGIGPVDDQFVGVFKLFFITVSGDIPHQQLIIGFDLLTADDRVFIRGTAHVSQWCLPADDFRHHVRNH